MNQLEGNVIWFRTDLRLEDHEGLGALENSEGPLVCVYVLPEDVGQIGPLGFERIGRFRGRFIAQSLDDLNHNLQELGQGLWIVGGRPEEKIPEIMRRFNLKTCRMEVSKAPYEQVEEQALREKLSSMGMECHTYHSHSLLKPEELPFDLSTLPNVFTAFRHKVEARFPDIECISRPKRLPEMPAGVENIETADLPAQWLDSEAKPALFKGGEKAALEHLHRYFASGRASTYKETRNGLLGDLYSTRFSPWLALGNVSPRTIWKALKAYELKCGANESTYWIGFELLWRDYFYFAMQKYGVRFFQAGGIRGQAPTVQAGMPEFQAWINGRTGQPFIDACMNELRDTGFLSNRGRQNAGSYLVHHLNVDWRWGAAWFEHALVDYDPCSNYGNWAYLAGVGNDPRPNRVFDPVRQADMYDADKIYQNTWKNRSA